MRLLYIFVITIFSYGYGIADVGFIATENGYSARIGNTELNISNSLALHSTDSQGNIHNVEYTPLTQGELNFIECGNTSKMHYYIESAEQQTLNSSESLLVKNFFEDADLRLQIVENQFRYDIILHSGSDIRNIKFRIDGNDEIQKNTSELILKKGSSKIVNQKIFAFQEDNYNLSEISCNYTLNGNVIGFESSEYDSSRELTIDPTIFFSMFGGSSNDKIIKTLLNGDELYILGTTNSTDYSAPDYSLPGSQSINNQDIFISRYRIIYSERKHIETVFIGGSDFDEITDAAFNDAGTELYIVGNTKSEDFPLLGTQHISSRGDLDGFFAKFDVSNMNMMFCSLFGGANWDYMTGIEVNSQGHFFIVGNTKSTSIELKGANQSFNAGGTDIFFAKYWNNGTDSFYSTFVGTSEDDIANDMTLNDDGYYIFIAGYTSSPFFEIIPKWDFYGKIFDRKHNGAKDGIIMVYEDGTSEYSYSTYYGGDLDDEITGISYYNDKLYFIGNTDSKLTAVEPASNATEFPVSPISYQKSNKGNTDGFLAICEFKLNLLSYSSFLGGSEKDSLTGIFVSQTTNGSPYVIGTTESINFPKLSTDQTSYNGNKDIILSKFYPNFSSLEFTEFIGTSTNDYPQDIVFEDANTYLLSGYTESDKFDLDLSPTLAHQGSFDGFLLKSSDINLKLETPLDLDVYCSNSQVNIQWNSGDLVNTKFRLEFTENNADYEELVNNYTSKSFLWDLDSANATPSDKYKIRLSAINGLIAEMDTTFSVISSPGNGVLQINKSSEELCVGDSITIFCDAPFQNLTYLWYINNKQIVNKHDSLVYKITSTGEIKVYCKLSNGCLPDTETNTLTVTVPEETAILEELKDTSVVEHHSLYLEANVNTSAHEINWYKDGKLYLENSNALDFQDIALQDSGYYNFEAIGRCNTVISEQFKITVKPDVSVDEVTLADTFQQLEILNNGSNNPSIKVISRKYLFTAKLFDNSGHELSDLGSQLDKLDIDFREITNESGLYWITIYFDNKTISKKIILVK